MADHRHTSATPPSDSNDDSRPQLPPHWTKCFSKTRQLGYYYNATTSESVWTIDEVLLIESGRKASENKRRSSNASATSPHASFSALKPSNGDKTSSDSSAASTPAPTPAKASTSAASKVKRVSTLAAKKAHLNIPDTAKTTPNELTESLKKKLHIRKAKAAETLVSKTTSRATSSATSVASASSSHLSKKSSIPIPINKASKKEAAAASSQKAIGKSKTANSSNASTPTKPNIREAPVPQTPSTPIDKQRITNQPPPTKTTPPLPATAKSSPQSHSSDALTNDMDVIELDESNLLTEDEDDESHCSANINFEAMEIDVIENVSSNFYFIFFIFYGLSRLVVLLNNL